uniref:Uncharacterized protein n=1 Tax=Glossina pallidipes TaxID=7398 RepID=A0A1A9ZG23_GLOPL
MSIKFAKDVFLVPTRNTCGGLITNFGLRPPAISGSVAITSQFVSNISPLGSMSFTPLSGSGLWEAVIITPTTEPPKTRDLKVANTPIRNITLSKKSALKVCNNIIKSFNFMLIKKKHNLNLCLDL